MTLRGLEHTAYRISEELRFEASIAQRAANYFIETDQIIDGHGSPMFHFMRGSLLNRMQNCEELYKDAEAVLEAAEISDLESFEKVPEEEVRLAKEKYFSYSLSHNFSGDLAEVMESHSERCFEALQSDIIGYDTGYHHLRSAKSDYEEFQTNLTQLNLNPLDPFIYTLTQREETEIIDEASEPVEIEEFDHILGKEF